MALRPVNGLDLGRFTRLFGAPPAQNVLEDLISNDLATRNGETLTLSTSGRLMADHIAALLTPQA
jgi:coproporphyrinogen III oxidase-like Fe-S oxidoreductase